VVVTTVAELMQTPVVMCNNSTVVNSSIEFVVQPPYDDATLYNYTWSFTNLDVPGVNVTVANGGVKLDQFFDTVGNNKGYQVVCRVFDAYSSVEYYGNVCEPLPFLLAIRAFAVRNLASVRLASDNNSVTIDNSLASDNSLAKDNSLASVNSLANDNGLASDSNNNNNSYDVATSVVERHECQPAFPLQWQHEQSPETSHRQ
jgi:hypothetical protein